MRLDEFVGKEFPGRLIFAKVWGSHSHNTALPTSDVDFLAVYAAPARELLSLSPPPETVDGVKPDFQAHEARKFCELLLKGNPMILECLFTERDALETPEWMELKAERRRFLSRRAVEQYLGYAEGQLKKLAHHGGSAGLHTKGGSYNTKWAYHLIRILTDGERVARGEGPLVWKQGDEQGLLMAIRNGRFAQLEVERMAQESVRRIEALRPWPLPDEGDRPFLNSWLLRLRGL